MLDDGAVEQVLAPLAGARKRPDAAIWSGAAWAEGRAPLRKEVHP